MICPKCKGQMRLREGDDQETCDCGYYQCCMADDHQAWTEIESCDAEEAARIYAGAYYEEHGGVGDDPEISVRVKGHGVDEVYKVTGFISQAWWAEKANPDDEDADSTEEK